MNEKRPELIHEEKHSRLSFLEKDEKTVIKTLTLMAVGGGGCPVAVEVKNDKIIRIRPPHYDWKYNHKDFNPWKIETNNKIFQPLFKSLPSPFSMAYKKRAYSPNRTMYPIKRIDWDPNSSNLF